MNPDTGHLVCPEGLKELQEMMVDSYYEQIPQELEEAAKLELAGKSEAYVGKQSTGSINTWAAKQREKKKALKRARKLHCR